MTNTTFCPQCQGRAYKRNGYTRHAKQNYRCLDCGRQFSAKPQTPAKFAVIQDSTAVIISV